MLIIRKPQLDALRKAREAEFEARAVAYLKQRFPERCRHLDDGRIQDSVRTAMRKRRAYRFDTEETVLLYLDLMYLLGFEFDTDPSYPWVQETLADHDLAPRTRLIVLTHRARQLLNRA